jgi:hypothetical protein
MATRKQRAANRRNAQLSTGPKTPEGKAAVRLNALKHGLTVEDAVIFEEDREAFNDLFNTLLDDLLPVGPLETAFVHQIVMAQWRLARCRKLETGIFALSYDDDRQDLEAGHPGFDPNEALAFLFRRNTETLATLSRYEARAERALYRALHELQRLQAARRQPDPPPPAKTDFAEQSQPNPETEPNPLPQNDLTPDAPVDPNIPGGLLNLPAHSSDSPPRMVSLRAPLQPNQDRERAEPACQRT